LREKKRTSLKREKMGWKEEGSTTSHREVIALSRGSFPGQGKKSLSREGGSFVAVDRAHGEENGEQAKHLNTSSASECWNSQRWGTMGEWRK